MMLAHRAGRRSGSWSRVRFFVVAGLACVGALGVFAVAGPVLARADSCPNAQFRTGPSASLPECRAFEKITPADKNGGDTNPGTIIDDDNVYLTSSASFLPEEPYYSAVTGYLAARSSDAWRLRTGFAAPHTPIVDVNADLSREILESGLVSLLPEDTDGAEDVYARNTDGSGLGLVSKGSLGGNSGDRAVYAGQSSDGSHVFFETAEHLEPVDAGRAQGYQLYERVAGQTRVVGLDPGGSLISDSGAVLGNGNNYGTSSAPSGSSNAISTDGSIIFFESPDPSLGGEHELYARVGGQETIRVSASRCQRVAPVCDDSGHPATFQGAAKDGSRVFFTTAGQLVDEDLDEAFDLYVYDLNTGQLTLISNDCVGPEGGSVDCGPDPARRDGVTTVSADGRRVYFVGPPAPVGFTTNASLFLYDDRDSTTRFVAPANNFNLREVSFGMYISAGATGVATNSDGGVLVFASPFRLTSFDNSAPDCGGGGGGGDLPRPCEEVYRYSAASGEIDCISCNRTGAAPSGDALFGMGDSFSTLSQGTGATHSRPTRVTSEDGRTIAFETEDAVLAKDTNGLPDVYLWRDGEVSLLTSGTSEASARLGGMTPDGRDIFFSTFDRLVPSDTDSQSDVYTARVDGGLPGDRPPAVSSCAGDACQAPLGSAPVLPGLGSSVFIGPGNPVAKGEPAKVKKKPVKKHKKKKTKKKHKKKPVKKGKGRAGKAGHGKRGAR